MRSAGRWRPGGWLIGLAWLVAAPAFADAATVEPARATAAIENERLGSLRLIGETSFDTPLAMAMAVAVGGGLVLLALFFVWNLSLRRTVAARTAALSEQLRIVGKAEDELRASEEKFRQLAELTSDWFWEQDADGRFTRVFGGGLDKLGLDPADYIGRARWDLPLLGVTAAEIEAHRRHWEQRLPFRHFTYQIRNRRGERRWVTVSGQPVFAADSAFLGYRGSGQDVTAPMQDQLARAELFDRLRALLDGTFSFIGLLDPAGTLIDCNRALADFVGVTKENVLGRSFWDVGWFSLPAEQVQVRQAIATARGGRFVRYDARHADADGAIYWIDFSLSPIFDADGRVVSLVAEGRDVTDDRRAADALGSLVSTTGGVHGSDYFRALVESLARLLGVRYVLVGRLVDGGRRVRSECFWADGRVVDNIEYDLAGTPCAETVGAGACVYPRGAATAFPEDRILAVRGIEAYLGVHVPNRSGQTIGIVVAMHTQPLVDTASVRQLLGLFAIRVGTEFERLDHEAQIGELNAGLERRVEQRTRELTQANRELEAFSYSVSHDLRAPLRHISGFVELLEENAGARLDDEGRRYLRIIADSADRLRRLIDDLLSFSRLGRAELHRTAIDSAELVAEVVAGFEPECRGRDIIWSLAPLPAVGADRALLRQVWGNLVGNAIKYSQGRTPARIEIGSEAAGEGEIGFFVRDNGVGFNMDYAHKLFGVFQRLHREDEFEGSGIGLANAKRIVERHGGRIWAEAVEGGGATFHFTLPAAAGSATTGDE